MFCQDSRIGRGRACLGRRARGAAATAKAAVSPLAAGRAATVAIAVATRRSALAIAVTTRALRRRGLGRLLERVWDDVLGDVEVPLRGGVGVG